MEANNFIAKIKASGADSDNHNIGESLNEYQTIVEKLSSKDKGTFSLNVLCILCRNLDKVPKWRDSIDSSELLRLTIQCLRHTRTLEGSENQVKALACIYHIHKHIVKQTSSVPPELVLKLSFMAFEFDDSNLLKDYCKTYWSILCDRLTYLEKLKTQKMPIVKLLSKFTEDTLKTINIYDTVQFCTNFLQFLIKKVHFIFNDWPKDLNNMFGQIFDCISKKDLKSFKRLPERESLDLYVKLNDILYIVTDNSLRNNFNHSVLDIGTRVCISLLGHRPDMFHCFQTFYLNSFCCIFRDKTNSALTENVLNSLLVSCQMTEKLGYKHTLHLTYPFISQLLRLFIEDIVTQKDCKDYLNETVQENCLILMRFLIKKLEKTNQLLKCENCKAKSGLHDALRLSFLCKNFITISTNNGIVIKKYLPIYNEVVEQQYVILNDLRRLGCFNHEKYFRKLQTDVHNTAILLNKCQIYDFSIKLFEIYLKNELRNIRNDADLKNISRALYNKSICELDFKLYNESLQNAYLSLIFSLPDGLNSDKYMNLVMDIKAKALKSLTEDDESNDLQMTSILDVCQLLYHDNLYGNLKPFMMNLKFSVLLKHEFTMYIKLWPSIVPIAGVWKSLHDLLKKKYSWVKDENEDLLLWTLYEIVLQTPSYVRTIHNDCFKSIVDQLLERFEETPASVQNKIVFASLLFLKAEYDIAEASLKYGWKVQQTTDPEQVQVTRTIEQEHKALTHAFKAVDVLTDVLPYLKTERTPACILSSSLKIYQVFVQQLLCMEQLIHGLHLALICCQVAEICEDKQTYIRNASALTSYMTKNGEFEPIMKQGMKYCGELMANVAELDVALVFMCEMACYYKKCGKISVSAKLVETVQKKLLWAQENHPSVDFSLSTGSLMCAQYLLRPDSGLSTLSALNAIQRHYLATSSDSSRWCARRTAAVHAQRAACSASVNSVHVARCLRVWRRAALAAAPRTRFPARTASRTILNIVNVASGDDAQIKIDNRLKYIIGLQPSSDVTHTDPKKQQLFTPKQTNLETMRDCMFKKIQTSPSLPCIPIPAYKTPDFMTHKHCKCHTCDPVCTIIACNISFLESATYFRANEFDIARNYFNGTVKMFEMAESKLRAIFEAHNRFNHSVIKVIQNKYSNEFSNLYIEFLTEFAFFELAQSEFEKADDCIVKIHEVMSGTDVEGYLRNEVHNLMVASAQIREIFKLKPKEIGLENELENLKLSPANVTDIPKTPETKIMPKIETLKIVKDEEVPKKRKVIKLNLDEKSPDEVEKTEKPKPKFKIPVPKPITSKPVIETITPRRTRSKPDITIQKPSLDEDFEIFTPKAENESQFFTPCQSTPAEQFFTPMTSLKTYSKRIVKNLESEFSTPKTNISIKEKDKQRKSRVESGSVKTLKDRRTLTRSTSPGKLVEENTVSARPRRMRQPNLSEK